MSDFYSEMTDNMKMLFDDILASLGQLPDEKKAFIFGEDDDLDMHLVVALAQYISLEYIKYAYDFNDKEYPLRHFLDNPMDDSERMLQSRVMKYVLEHKKRELESSKAVLPQNHKFADIDMKRMENKLKGRRLTTMNFYEHKNIYELKIIKAIVEERLSSSKKVSDSSFQDMFCQYDKTVEDFITRSRKSDEDMVFASLAFFTLEWHYGIEFLYELACMLEEEGSQEVDYNMLGMVFGSIEIESRFGGWAHTDSRMVKERLVLIPFLIDKPEVKHQQIKQFVFDIIREIIVLVAYYKEVYTTNEGELYKDWFRKNGDIKDWASFFRGYNVFSIWIKKEWTRKRIQNMRMLVNQIMKRNGLKPEK